MQQYRSLFDKSEQPAKLSRKSDPITSQQSAAETEKKLGRLFREFMSVLREMAAPATAREIDRECKRLFGGVPDSHRKRVARLRELKLIEDCGERPCSVSGANAMTFRVRVQK